MDAQTLVALVIALVGWFLLVAVERRWRRRRQALQRAKLIALLGARLRRSPTHRAG
jgi:hypothetical protein